MFEVKGIYLHEGDLFSLPNITNIDEARKMAKIHIKDDNMCAIYDVNNTLIWFKDKRKVTKYVHQKDIRMFSMGSAL